MPGYPLAAMRRGEQGVTAVLIHVTESGAVDDVKVERSSGSKLLDQAAVDAFLKWRFDRLAPGSAPRGRWLRTAQRFVLYAFTYSRLDAEAVNSMYAEHLKPKPGTDDEVTPGVQQALAGFMAAVRDGTFAIQDDKLRPAFAELRATLAKWGAVKSVRFSGLAGSNRWTRHWSAPLAGATRREVEVSWNMFEVRHENATSEWLIAADRDGGVWAVRAGQASWK
jgi:TonB family protein